MSTLHVVNGVSTLSTRIDFPLTPVSLFYLINSTPQEIKVVVGAAEAPVGPQAQRSHVQVQLMGD